MGIVRVLNDWHDLSKSRREENMSGSGRGLVGLDGLCSSLQSTS